MKIRFVTIIFLLSAIFGAQNSGLMAQNISGTWTGLLDTGMGKLHIVFHFQKDASGNDVCTMDVPEQSVKGLHTTLPFISEDSVSVSVPMLAMTYQGRLSGDNVIYGTFRQSGMSFTMNMKQEKPEYNRPQNPTEPYPYKTEEVAFSNEEAGAVLSGTLSYPVGYKEGDKVPVVLMVNGSGPENRDSEIYEHKPFLVIADYLARNGIATLRYDDRAVGKSTGKSVTFTTEEAAQDAGKGIEYLRQRKEFSSVGILGHSEGANIAFMLGAKKLVDFAVCMAGVGVKGDEAIYAQAKKITELSGQTYPLTMEQFRSIGQQNPWMNYFFNYDPASDIQNTVCPVFALNGDKDLQVLPDLNLKAIEKNLPENRRSMTRLYPGLNHLFQHCETGHPNEYVNIEETVSPEVLKDIADWINSL